MLDSTAPVIRGLREWSRVFGDLIYPRDCVTCAADLNERDTHCFCETCRDAFPRIGKEQCPRCGDALGPYAAGRKACGSCAGRPGLFFRGAVAVSPYETVARDMIHRFKYSGDLRCVTWMAGEMGGRLRRAEWLDKIDGIVPVPLHWRRHVWRRFNQSELLARRLARECGKPLLRRVLRRVRKTHSQSVLTPKAREENVRGAFRVMRKEPIAGKVLLLVDDVMTTCATVAECSRCLVKAGARGVYVAVFAR